MDHCLALGAYRYHTFTLLFFWPSCPVGLDVGYWILGVFVALSRMYGRKMFMTFMSRIFGLAVAVDLVFFFSSRMVFGVGGS